MSVAVETRYRSSLAQCTGTGSNMRCALLSGECWLSARTKRVPRVRSPPRYGCTGTGNSTETLRGKTSSQRNSSSLRPSVTKTVLFNKIGRKTVPWYILRYLKFKCEQELEIVISMHELQGPAPAVDRTPLSCAESVSQLITIMLPLWACIL